MTEVFSGYSEFGVLYSSHHNSYRRLITRKLMLSVMLHTGFVFKHPISNFMYKLELLFYLPASLGKQSGQGFVIFNY